MSTTTTARRLQLDDTRQGARGSATRNKPYTTNLSVELIDSVKQAASVFSITEASLVRAILSDWFRNDYGELVNRFRQGEVVLELPEE